MFAVMQVVAAAALTVAVTYWGIVRHRARHVVAGLAAVVILAAVISGAVVNLIPLPTNEVIVTATGEKNENAANNEVYIVNYLVGGKEYAVQPPTEGKWFWKGNAYMWRNENDPRQPAGTTRSVTLNIPYGKDRRIQFGLSQWNGIVEVTYGDDTNRYDLFKTSEKSSLYVPVPDTEAVPLYGIKLLRLALYTAMILLLSAYPALCAIRYSDGQIATFWGRHWDKLYYLLLAILYILLMQKNSVDGSFWGDEIWELGWKYTQNPYTTNYIFYYISKFWLFLMPYGQEYLLLLPQIAVGITIYLAGIIGNKMRGKLLGILFSSLVAFSLCIIYQCAMEYRVYSFLLLSTTLMLYTFIRKIECCGHEDFGIILIHSLAITLVMDMHTFGIPVAGLFLLADLILVITKKASAKCFLEFIIPCIYGIWWLVTYVFDFVLNNINVYASWMEPPDMDRVISTITWLEGSSPIMFALLLWGIAAIIFNIILNTIDGKHVFFKDYVRAVTILIPAILISIVYIYSTRINPEHPLFFDRYFISIIIFLLYITAEGLFEVVTFITDATKHKYISHSALVVTILLLCIYSWRQVGPWEIYPANDHTNISTYKMTADYLMSQNDIYCDSTVVLLDHNKDATTGFQYYLTHKGMRDMINCQNSMPKDIGNYDTFYCTYIIPRSRKKLMSEENILMGNDFILIEDNKEMRILKFVRASQVSQ